MDPTQPDPARPCAGILVGRCQPRAVLTGPKVQQKTRRAPERIKEQIPFIRLQGCRLDPVPVTVNQFHTLVRLRGLRLTVASQKIGRAQCKDTGCKSNEVAPAHTTVYEMRL